jgi:hypothetical protein
VNRAKPLLQNEKGTHTETGAYQVYGRNTPETTTETARFANVSCTLSPVCSRSRTATAEKPSRIRQAIWGALAFLALSAPAHAGKTVTLGCSDGGNVAHHVMIAHGFLKHRHRLVITCNRASAAAIQVIWYRKHGGKVCAKPGVRLFLHMGYDPEKRVAVDVNRQYLGRSYREGWYHPSKFKIGEC